MERLLNKKWWQKLIIALFIVIMFTSIVAKPVQAMDADILLKPITGLFVGLADALEGVMQKIVLGVDESLVEVKDEKAGFWANVLVIGAFIVGTAIAIVAAIPSGGASAIAWVGFVAAAVATLCISCGTYAIIGTKLTTLIEKMFGNSVYFPQFALSPYEIFDNKITVLDVNFFSPKTSERVVKKEWETEWHDVEIPSNMIVDTKGVGGGYDQFCVKQEEFDNMFNFSKGDPSQKEELIDKNLYGGKALVPSLVSKWSTYNWKSKDGNRWYQGWIEDKKNKDGESVRWVYGLKYRDLIISTIDLKSPANELKTYISGWYKTLRNLALVALLSILVYIGIRILLSSVASDKAKYKQMLLDWVVALSILFVMHYIMSFSVYIVEKFRDMIDSIQINTDTKNQVLEELNKEPGRVKTSSNKSSGSTHGGGDFGGDDQGKQVENADDLKLGEAVEIFILDGDSGKDMKELVQKAYSIFSNEEKGITELSKYFFTGDRNENGELLLDKNATSKDEAKVLIWPAQNFMEQARINYQIKRKSGDENVAMYGYGLIYVILVVYTIIFLFTYMKRIVYMAFLTVIAPLVAVTYPIDKMNDGKAQAFSMWFREYIFNLLIQPLHLLLYSVLIGSAMNFASDNLVYVVMALGFFVPAEKMLRRFFGFEKAQTPGLFGGPAGSALMFSGLQRLMHPKLPHKGLGAGNGKDEKGEEDSKAPRTQKIDETGGFLGEGNEGEANNSWGLSNDTYSPDSGRFNLLNGNGTNDDEDNGRALRFSSNGWGADSNAFGQFSTGNGLTQLGSTQVPRLSVPNSSTLPRRRRVRKAIGRTFRGYRTGLHNRYMAKKAQNGGLLRRGVRLAGGLATATAFTAAAGIAGITSGDLSKAGQYMSAGAVGGYKVGSSLGDKAAGGVKNQKDMITNALKEGKKGYQGSDYARKQQEKYIKEFKKNEEYLNALQDRLNVDREKAQKIMDTHAKDYIDNDITNIDDFAAVYQLEQEFGNRDKAIATRHYAMDRLNGQKVKNIDPETKAKYDNMFRQEFIKRGQSEAQANATVNELYNAVNKFHKYRK